MEEHAARRVSGIDRTGDYRCRVDVTHSPSGIDYLGRKFVVSNFDEMAEGVLYRRIITIHKVAIAKADCKRRFS